ncbi:MAG TPA: hypothetical protein VFW19_10600 [Allosphingosinicella sp.]|nr:hypothetical protein [Allosphingosinicella sp.]
MTDIVNDSALAIAKQSAPGSYNAPSSSTDTLPVANLSAKPNSIKATSPEYTGTIHKAGDIVLGATWDVTFDLLIRGPGGASPPAANAFIIGRVLQALGFTEQVISSAIPASPEALGVGSTTTMAVLGSSAAGTAALYQALGLNLASDGGTYPMQMTMIRAYNASKNATLPETRVAAPTGNYQIPKQLAYTYSASTTPPLLSISLWQGNRQYNFQDMVPSSAKLSFPTSSQSQTSFATLSVTMSGNLNSYSDTASPVVTPGSAIPPVRGGKLYVGGLTMGGSSLDLNFGVKVGFPPNPNQAAGNDPAQLVETMRTLTMTLNQVAKSYNDLIALATAQTYLPIELTYGSVAGNAVGFIVTDARLDFPAVSASGDFFAAQVDALIDNPASTIGLVFPY